MVKKSQIILIVDDNHINRYVVSKILREAGFEVKEAETGTQALSLAAQQPDLIILDVKLPDINGFELCKQLKANPDTALIPVLHLSAVKITCEDKVQGLEGGADGYLTHPVNPLELTATVKALLRIRQTEEKLQQSEQKFRAIFNQTFQFVWLLDTNGNLIEANQSALDFTGLKLTDVVDRPFWSVCWRSLSTTTSDRLQTAIATAALGSFVRYEVELLGAGDRVATIDFSLKPIKDHTGQVMLLIAEGRDISDRKQAEQERANLLELEKQARNAAETANRIKDDFLATLSHELRTPLNAIFGWSNILRSRPQDPATVARAIEIIERNAKLQTQLIEDLLDISRILRGQLNLNISSVNLAEPIEAAIETMHLAATAKSIQIQSLIDPYIGFVAGDANRLQQIVWNLLSNAIKFTPDGGSVQIHLKQVGTMAQITVSDTGKGISESFLPFVFEYFRQADASTTRKYGGMGLGLAIVRHLVELHGGTIHASSPGDGKGATFTITLPLLSASQETPRLWRNSNLNFSDSSQDLSLKGMRVLVVDDEADSREFVSFLLEQYEAVVESAASGTQALEIFERFKPDLLICDIGMPDLDGYATIREIKARSKQQGDRVKALALTAYCSEEDSQKALSAGFDLHLPKPIDPTELVIAIANT